jgi:hypothetical protein
MSAVVGTPPRHHQGSNKWEVKLIRTKAGGYGFSGGWRGFAVDQVGLLVISWMCFCSGSVGKQQV